MRGSIYRRAADLGPGVTVILGSRTFLVTGRPRRESSDGKILIDLSNGTNSSYDTWTAYENDYVEIVFAGG